MTRFGLAAQLSATAPVDREEARQAAERELSKGIYHQNEPGPVARAVEAVLDWFQELLSQAPGGAGQLGLVVLGLMIAAGVLVLVRWADPLRGATRSGTAETELSGPLDPAEHRRRAEAYAAEGKFAESIRERMRAIVRELENRAVLEPRPGRTADEVAREAAQVVPTIAADLRTAAVVFDEVWYGGRPATPAAEAAIRQADQRVRRARLVVASGDVPTTTGYQVPR